MCMKHLCLANVIYLSFYKEFVQQNKKFQDETTIFTLKNIHYASRKAMLTFNDDEPLCLITVPR